MVVRLVISRQLYAANIEILLAVGKAVEAMKLLREECDERFYLRVGKPVGVKVNADRDSVRTPFR